MAGRKAWYEWDSVKRNGHPARMEGSNAIAHSQDLPRWLTSHVPKSAPKSRTLPDSTQIETKEETNGSEKIAEKLKEIIRYKKRLYYIRRVWQGFVKTEDIMETQPMKELKARSQDIEWAAEKEPRTFEEETWMGDKYIRLKSYGPIEENQKRLEGKR